MKTPVVHNSNLHELIDDGDGLAGWDYSEAEAEYEEYVEKLEFTSRPQVLGLIGKCHLLETRLDGESVLFHTQLVSRGAGKLMRIYQKHRPLQETRYYILAAEIVGLLHEIMPVSRLSYEDLCQLTNPTVALAVCALTPDLRRNASSRREHFCNAVACAGHLAQIVLLSDIGQDYYMHLDLVDARTPGCLEPAASYCEDSLEYIRNLSDLHRHVDLRGYVNQMREQISALEKRVSRNRSRALPYRRN